MGYSPWSCKELDMTEHMPQLIFVYMGILIFSSVQFYYMFCSFIYHHSEERRRQWHPTPVLLPGKSHGRRSLVGCRPWGHEELDTTSLSLFIFFFFAACFPHTLTFIRHFELIHKLLLSSFGIFQSSFFLLLQMLHFIDILNSCY